MAPLSLELFLQHHFEFLRSQAIDPASLKRFREFVVPGLQPAQDVESSCEVLVQPCEPIQPIRWKKPRTWIRHRHLFV
jgi:hypothetical protein